MPQIASIIHRKARGGTGGNRGHRMSPVKALRLGLARTADSLFDLALTVSMVEQVKLLQENMADTLADDGLLLLIEGGGHAGAVRLDLQFLTALIEAQTTGKVRAAIARPRAVTRTDAAIAAPLIDGVMAEMQAHMRTDHEDDGLSDFKCAGMVGDLHALGLILTAPSYELYTVSAEIANGAKSGTFHLILPQMPTPGNGAPDPDLASALSENLLNTTITLEAIVARLSLPLSRIFTLRKGQVFPLDAESLQRIELTGAKGHVAAKGALGRMNGCRALRLGDLEGPLHPHGPDDRNETGQGAEAPGRPHPSAGKQTGPDPVPGAGEEAPAAMVQEEAGLAEAGGSETASGDGAVRKQA